MNMTSAKIPIYKAGGLATIAYLLALVLLNASVKSPEFWSEMFATPRFRTGLILYSALFLAIGIVLVALGRWNPTRTSFVITRRVMLGGSIIALVLAVGLMNVFGSGFDFKLSGP